uniref:Uncharacterized protein n=1 Tax=Glossina palpalis gambiensis TaxID=67801 RepID=A0A1B0BLL7_9MUSC
MKNSHLCPCSSYIVPRLPPTSHTITDKSHEPLNSNCGPSTHFKQRTLAVLSKCKVIKSSQISNVVQITSMSFECCYQLNALQIAFQHRNLPSMITNEGQRTLAVLSKCKVIKSSQISNVVQITSMSFECPANRISTS